MASKEIELELLYGDGGWCYPVFTAEWSYSYEEPCHTEGMYSPGGEESEIYIENMEQLVTNMNPSVAAENILLAYQQLSALSEDLEQWAQDEAQSHEEAEADAAYDRMREDR